MCDIKAYVRKNHRDELLLESVNHVHAEHNEVVVRNLFGEEKRVRGAVRELSLAKNILIVEQE